MLMASIDDSIANGSHVTLVLHTWLIETERDAVRAILGHAGAAEQRGEVWAARCDEVAAWVQSHPDLFTDAANLDTTSWST
jgi:hypothetical protein